MSAFPHEELDRLDKENVTRLLDTQRAYTSFYTKHPFFETDPACRLARQLALMALNNDPNRVDVLVVNCYGSPSRGPGQGTVNHGPGDWKFDDFLMNGNCPRPLWLAWYKQAKDALAAQAIINGDKA